MRASPIIGVIALALALTALGGCGGPNWKYERGERSSACVKASERLIIASNGDHASQAVEFCIVKRGSDAIAYLKAAKDGPIVCANAQGCSVNTALDDGALETIPGRQFPDQAPGTILFADGDALAAKIKAAKTMRMYIPDDKGHRHEMHFAVQGLEWPVK